MYRCELCLRSRTDKHYDTYLGRLYIHKECENNKDVAIKKGNRLLKNKEKGEK